DLWRAVEAFSGIAAAVIGDAMLDTYLQGVSSRLSQEAPVPVVALSGRADAGGGAANAALNVRDLGARTVLLSVIGDDPEGCALVRVLERGGVSIDGVLRHPSRRTLCKQRVL